MPTYEYECTTCGQHIEVFQRFSEDSLTVCGVCGGVLRKVFHPAGIVFKGSGFYVTDSRSTGKARSSEKGDKADKGATSGKGGDKTAPSKADAGSSSSSSSSSSSESSEGGSKSSDAGGSKAAATKDPG
ncbi:MAG: FmdB family zinc ribbon protein [Actinomycetota bacterium]